MVRQTLAIIDKGENGEPYQSVIAFVQEDEVEPGRELRSFKYLLQGGICSVCGVERDDKNLLLFDLEWCTAMYHKTTMKVSVQKELLVVESIDRFYWDFHIQLEIME